MKANRPTRTLPFRTCAEIVQLLIFPIDTVFHVCGTHEMQDILALTPCSAKPGFLWSIILLNGEDAVPDAVPVDLFRATPLPLVNVSAVPKPMFVLPSSAESFILRDLLAPEPKATDDSLSTLAQPRF